MNRTCSKRERFEIFKRDGFKCCYCGKAPPEVILHIDHVVPHSKGGTCNVTNLVTACADCNLGKGAVMMERIQAPMNLDAKARKEKLDQLIAYQKVLMEERELEEDAMHELMLLWAKWDGQDEKDPIFHIYNDIRDATRKFLKHLPPVEIAKSMTTACERFNRPGRDRDRYYFGICWNKIKNPTP